MRPSTVRGRGRLARVAESIESRLWPLPVAAIAAAVVLGILLPRLDLIVDSDLPIGVDSAVFNGGAETARSVLSSIAGSLITATSLTFSLTVVALQLASSQASPRVLRLFSRDRQVHATLAVFLGTFAYAITVLRSIRDSTDDDPEFVPRIAVTVGFALTLVSVIMLVFFLAHLAAQLRVETIMKEIHAETDRTIDLVGDSQAAVTAFEGRITLPEHREVVRADSSGFVTSVDRLGLIRFATDHGIVVQETKRVGESIVAGTPQAFWWVAGGLADPTGPGGAPEPAEVDEAVRRAMSIGYERTAAQDVDYGVQQILDIGVRALSAGINDPTTAVNALGHLGALLARAVALPALPTGLASEDGRLGVVTASRSAAEFVRDSLTPMRHYGAGDPAVVTRLLQTVSDLAYCCPDRPVVEALLEQLSALERQLARDESDPSEAARLLQATEALSIRLRSAI
ncbi:DUF2254 domain-containing protein [Herbiconiux liukaitaii]|uniref:DUF2254 domain-containing protein n=1 Tax=Herbiconiux liukaitaii TaxID=3342799 RepID=UPI0035BB7109